MKLIGMLDSPYVRRVAISLHLLQLPFEHEAVSVFRTFEKFQSINPVVKAPTFICDDGTVLMDSTLILEYIESLARPRSLISRGNTLASELRLIGLALAACDKSVQIYYEYNQRPADKIHPLWVERATGQLLAAYGEIEKDLGKKPLKTGSADISQAGVSIAVAWFFSQQMLKGIVPPARFPLVAALSAAAETLPEFRAVPFGGIK